MKTVTDDYVYRLSQS